MLPVDEASSASKSSGNCEAARVGNRSSIFGSYTGVAGRGALKEGWSRIRRHFCPTFDRLGTPWKSRWKRSLFARKTWRLR